MINKKVTSITINPTVENLARKHAKKESKSFSGLIEGLLKSILISTSTNKTRYFIVTYFYTDNTEFGFNEMEFITCNGSYPNRKAMKEKAMKEKAKKLEDYDKLHITIFTPKELSKQEFDNYIDEGD